MKKIFIIEDDKNLAGELNKLLENQGYQVFDTDNYIDSSKEVLASGADLLILDINLPGISGYDICRNLKSKSNIPILMLTSRTSVEDEIEGLSIGADEYLAKPIDTRRLLLRLEKLLNLFSNFDDCIILDNLYLELSTNKLSYDGAYIILTETEADIIKNLMMSAPKLISKEQLLMAVWNTEYIDENILQVNLTRLRKKVKKLGPISIINERSKGYFIMVENDE